MRSLAAGALSQTLTKSAGLAIAAPIMPLAIPAVNFVPNEPSSAHGLILSVKDLQMSYVPMRIPLCEKHACTRFHETMSVFVSATQSRAPVRAFPQQTGAQAFVHGQHPLSLDHVSHSLGPVRRGAFASFELLPNFDPEIHRHSVLLVQRQMIKHTYKSKGFVTHAATCLDVPDRISDININVTSEQCGAPPSAFAFRQPRRGKKEANKKLTMLLAPANPIFCATNTA